VDVDERLAAACEPALDPLGRDDRADPRRAAHALRRAEIRDLVAQVSLELVGRDHEPADAPVPAAVRPREVDRQHGAVGQERLARRDEARARRDDGHSEALCEPAVDRRFERCRCIGDGFVTTGREA
jgi:hypothetical protein